ncbi:MAG: hypothetical protein JW807_14830 [Spirochaetes bacterium]|nr:hypothetical protein [Spirochaetota bacterium]
MKKILPLLFVCILSQYLTAGNGDEAVLAIKNITTAHKAKSMQSKAEISRQVSAYTLTLNDGYFHVEDNNVKRFYDFDKRRITFINKKDKSYYYVPSVYSLHYRTAEFNNRIFQMDAFNSAGVSDNPYKLFELESLFGIKSDTASGGEITVEKKDDSTVYSREKKTILATKPSARKIEERLRKAWRMFWTHEENIHPDLRAMVVKDDFFPRVYRYDYANAPFASYEVNCSVEKISLRKKGDDPTRGYRFAFSGTDDLAAIINRVHNGDIEKAKVSYDTLKHFVKERMDVKEYLDAWLGIVEYILQEGVPPRELIELLRPHFQSDAKLSSYMRASEEKDYKKANGMIDSIDRKGLKKGHIMKITQAVNYLIADETIAARGLFLEVLKISPGITGVYYDLGKTYVPNYEMMLAWLCWDTARYLNPEHPFSREVTKMENFYFNKYPDFF